MNWSGLCNILVIMAENVQCNEMMKILSVVTQYSVILIKLRLIDDPGDKPGPGAYQSGNLGEKKLNHTFSENPC